MIELTDAPKKQTLGEIALKAMESDDQFYIDEITKAQTPRFMEEWGKALEHGKKNREGDFYVVSSLKEEKMFTNNGAEVIQIFHYDRATCPVPTYNTTVCRYSRKDDKVEVLFAIPDINTCEYLYQNMLNCPPEFTHILPFVVGFMDGSLNLEWMKLDRELDEIAFKEKDTYVQSTNTTDARQL